MNTDFAEAAACQYVLLTTFRTSGAGVATPVWIAPDGDELVVITLDGVGKTKRLARNPHVELRPCDLRGNVTGDAPTWTGTARVVREADDLAAVRRAIGAKYVSARLGYLANTLTFGLVQRKPRAGIRIRLS